MVDPSLSGDPHRRGVVDPGLSDDPHRHVVVDPGLSGDPHRHGVVDPGLSGDPHRHGVVDPGLSGDPHRHGVVDPGLSGDPHRHGVVDPGLSGDPHRHGVVDPGLSGDPHCHVVVYSGLSGDYGDIYHVHNSPNCHWRHDYDHVIGYGDYLAPDTPAHREVHVPGIVLEGTVSGVDDHPRPVPHHDDHGYTPAGNVVSCRWMIVKSSITSKHRSSIPLIDSMV